MKRVLVAGATGQLGRYVIDELKRRGYRVRAITRDRSKLQEGSVDEILEADLTDPSSLQGICDGIDIVFSCAGAVMDINNWKDRRSFNDVDYRGNLNLLNEAKKSSVAKYTYVSLSSAEKLRGTEYVDAHERFVEALKASGIGYTIIRPTGFFSFFLEILRFASRGRGFVIGSGECRTNPIYEGDLAKASVDALEKGVKELSVGGPDVYTRKQLTDLAFEVLGKKPRIMKLSPGLFKLLIQPLRLLNRRIYALMAFGVAVTQVDVVSRAYGSHRLKTFFEEAAGKLSEG